MGMSRKIPVKTVTTLLTQGDIAAGEYPLPVVRYYRSGSDRRSQIFNVTKLF